MSNTVTSTFAAAGFGIGTRPSKMRAMASAICAKLGRDRASARPPSSASTADSTGPSSWHCLGPGDMPFEAKLRGHGAVAIPQVRVSRAIAVSPCQESL